MSVPLAELETVMRDLIVEHQKLLRHLDGQQEAMKRLDFKAIDDATQLQEASRLRIGTLETRRRLIVMQLSRMLKLDGQPTMARLADAMPAAKAKLLGLRDQLKAIVAQVQSRATVAGRLAGAVVGHLNTVVRLVAGAVEQAGLYNKHGVAQVSSRIGVMEAVG